MSARVYRSNQNKGEALMPLQQQQFQLFKEFFLCPRKTYRGEFTPAKLAFNANLQEFAHRVSIIAALHTGGNLSTIEAYGWTAELWEELRQSKSHLGLR
jgi:hypothetical protein